MAGHGCLARIFWSARHGAPTGLGTAHSEASGGRAPGRASQIDNPYEQARAHDGLGRAYHAAGDLGKAREHWQVAMTRYGELGVPEADLVRAQLTAAADGILPDP
jgi:hypothetical protein